MQDKNTKDNSYHYINLKWVFGLLFSFTLFINILLFLLFKLSSPEVAIPIASVVVANQFSKSGLDDTRDIDKIKKQFLSTGRDRFYPFRDEQNIYLTRNEINTLSPKDIRLKIFQQVVEPVYYAKSEIDLQQYGILAKINVNLHNKLTNIFNLTLIPLVLFLSGFVYFSYGLGKLINPALTLIIFSGLPALLLYLMQHFAPPPGDTGPLSFLPKEEIIKIMKPISLLFNVYFSIGIILISIAIILKMLKKKSD